MMRITDYKDIIIAIDKIEKDPKLTARENERKAEKNMLQQLFGDDVVLSHNADGKPEIDGYNISISHTLNKQGGYIAIIIAKHHRVGIDIEYRSNRIIRILERFLRDDETTTSVDDALISWCAKEAVYKLFSSDDLTYQQMKVSPARDSVENIVRRRSVPINTCMTPGYIMVWTTLVEED